MIFYQLKNDKMVIRFDSLRPNQFRTIQLMSKQKKRRFSFKKMTNHQILASLYLYSTLFYETLSDLYN